MRTTAYPPNTVIDRPRATNVGPLAPVQAKTIPFDYVFEFKLKGKDATNTQDIVKLQDVVEISMQGVFVGVSLGYSFVLDERRNPRGFEPTINTETMPQNPIVIPVLGTAAVPGGVIGLLIVGTPNGEMTILQTKGTDIEKAFVSGTPLQTDFRDLNATVAGKTDVVRTGADGRAEVLLTSTSRSLTSDGVITVWDRRNNRFSQPMDPINPSIAMVGPNLISGKLPVSGDDTITIHGQVGVRAQIDLLDSANASRERVLDPAGSANFLLGTLHPVAGFDVGVATVKLPRKLKSGDTLVISSPTAPLPASVYKVPTARLSDVPLGAIFKGLAASNFGSSRGFSVSSRAMNQLNQPLGAISQDILSKAFEPACGAEGVSFLYSIDVVSTGRELQNKPIHNIAGLGIANGDRPFRPFAKPIAFEPRSVIRIQIEELSTLPGTLYIVLQGYKTLGTGRIPE